MYLSQNVTLLYSFKAMQIKIEDGASDLDLNLWFCHTFNKASNSSSNITAF